MIPRKLDQSLGHLGPAAYIISTSIDKNLTVMRDQKWIQSDDGQDTSDSKGVEQPTTTTDDEGEQEGGGGAEEEEEGEGESEDQEEIKTKVEATKEQLLKCLERMHAGREPRDSSLR